MQIVKVPQLAWYDTGYLELPVPDDWQIETFHTAGYDRPEIKPEEIRRAIRDPICTRPLRELATGKKEVAIVFDDITRVTRTSKIIPYVLEELSAAGIPDNNIRFICGLGMHGALGRSDFVKKLGEDVVARFRVFNHNPFGNCKYVGTTGTFKTRLAINEEYTKCDLRILVGACEPHLQAGFGGSSKLIMPGISSYESIQWHHKLGGAATAGTEDKPNPWMGLINGNLFKKDIDEAAELAGIDFLINVLVNLWGETVSVYAGSWKETYAAAVKEARTHYHTPGITDKDIVIANNYARASEAAIGLMVSVPMVSARGGDIVLIANAPEGQAVHYLLSCFGKTSFAVQHPSWPIPPHVNKVFLFSEYPHPGGSWFEAHEKIEYMSRWDDVLKSLKRNHGPGTRIAVIPDATNQYFASSD